MLHIVHTGPFGYLPAFTQVENACIVLIESDCPLPFTVPASWEVCSSAKIGIGQSIKVTLFAGNVIRVFNLSYVLVQGVYGYYWSSTPDGSDKAYYLHFASGYQDVRSVRRDYGYSVRAVLAK